MVGQAGDLPGDPKDVVHENIRLRFLISSLAVRWMSRSEVTTNLGFVCAAVRILPWKLILS